MIVILLAIYYLTRESFAQPKQHSLLSPIAHYNVLYVDSGHLPIPIEGFIDPSNKHRLFDFSGSNPQLDYELVNASANCITGSAIVAPDLGGTASEEPFINSRECRGAFCGKPPRPSSRIVDTYQGIICPDTCASRLGGGLIDEEVMSRRVSEILYTDVAPSTTHPYGADSMMQLPNTDPSRDAFIYKNAVGYTYSEMTA